MEVIFFNSQVKNDLYSLHRNSLDKTIRLMELLKMFGNNLRMPYSKKIHTNLYELRVKGNQEVRILYCFNKNKSVILHHFIKKSQKTPKREIETALNRIQILTNT